MTHLINTFRFEVELNGSKAGFTEFVDMGANEQTLQYREGSVTQHGAGRLPGMSSGVTVILKRGLVPADGYFYRWITTSGQIAPEPHSVTVSLVNEEGKAVKKWTLEQAIPLKLEGGSSAHGNELAVESLELACDYVKST